MSEDKSQREEKTSLQQWQLELENKSSEERLLWAEKNFSGEMIMTSSFGIQAAICLHLTARLREKVPIIFIDTGYLFKETYLYANKLADIYRLDIHCYCPKITPSHQEAIYGRLWENGIEGLNLYLELTKLEPMRRALDEWKPSLWISGLRRQQADSRANRPVIEEQGGVFKLYPIVDWSDQEVSDFVTQHNLPRHPLEIEGYISVGDWHSTTKWGTGMRAQDVRYGGLKRECGLHDHAAWCGENA